MLTETNHIRLENIVPSTRNPRRPVTTDEVITLANSIQMLGLQSPILVRPLPLADDDGAACQTFEIVAGERRFRACQLLKQEEIPAIVRELTDEEAVENAITENSERKDLSPIETARGFRFLLDANPALTQEVVAARFARNQSYIAQHLMLLKLPEEVQEMIHTGQLSKSHGIELSPLLEWPHTLEVLAGKAVSDRLSQKELAAEVREIVRRLEEKKQPSLDARWHREEPTTELEPIPSDHVHVALPLPNGTLATANVSPDIQPETIEALTVAADLVVKAVEEETLPVEAPSRHPADSGLSFVPTIHHEQPTTPAPEAKPAETKPATPAETAPPVAVVSVPLPAASEASPATPAIPESDTDALERAFAAFPVPYIAKPRTSDFMAHLMDQHGLRMAFVHSINVDSNATMALVRLLAAAPELLEIVEYIAGQDARTCDTACVSKIQQARLLSEKIRGVPFPVPANDPPETPAQNPGSELVYIPNRFSSIESDDAAIYRTLHHYAEADKRWSTIPGNCSDEVLFAAIQRELGGGGGWVNPNGWGADCRGGSTPGILIKHPGEGPIGPKGPADRRWIYGKALLTAARRVLFGVPPVSEPSAPVTEEDWETPCRVEVPKVRTLQVTKQEFFRVNQFFSGNTIFDKKPHLRGIERIDGNASSPHYQGKMYANVGGFVANEAGRIRLIEIVLEAEYEGKVQTAEQKGLKFNNVGQGEYRGVRVFHKNTPYVMTDREVVVSFGDSTYRLQSETQGALDV